MIVFLIIGRDFIDARVEHSDRQDIDTLYLCSVVSKSKCGSSKMTLVEDDVDNVI
jgi:hypothetical protein